MDWNSYFNFLSAEGQTEKQRMINQARYDLKHNYKSTLSHKCVCIDGIEHNVLILSMNTNSGTTNEKKIVMMPNDCLHIGQYVTWNNDKWLVTDINDDKEISYTGKIEKCNAVLKFQNTNNEIVSYQVVKKESTGSNTKTSNYVEIISGNYELYVPFNKDTAKISINKRFILWNQGNVPEVYKLIRLTPVLEHVDPIKTGYLIFTMERDVYNPNTDNAELMIADYVDDTHSGEKIILTYDKSELVIGGKKLTITSNIKNCTWSYETLNGFEKFFHSESNEDVFSIWCDEDYNLLGQTVVVKCSDELNHADLTLKVVSRI